MKTVYRNVLVAVIMAVTWSSGPLYAGSPKTDQGISNDKLAERLVTQCARVQEQDIVLINGGVRDLELLEDIATHIRKLGAFPLVTVGSDRMDRRYFDDVPAAYDGLVPELDLKLATMVSAMITVSYREKQGLFSDVPPERFVAIGEAYNPVGELLLARNVRQVSLGNNLYPTEDRAKMFNISQEGLAEQFWAGVSVDYSELERIGQRVKEKLAAGKELHISNSNGTDLRVQIESRPVFVSDGVISDSDLKMGGAACQLWLPAGEAYLAPVPGTANGKVVVDRQFYEGKEINGLELTFKNGKLTSMRAKSGIERLKAAYDAAGEGKDDFGLVDVGLNPNVEIPPGSSMVAWMASGMITVGIGNNSWAGGENSSSYSLFSYLPGSTLKVDSETLVDKGVLIP